MGIHRAELVMTYPHPLSPVRATLFLIRSSIAHPSDCVPHHERLPLIPSNIPISYHLHFTVYCIVKSFTSKVDNEWIRNMFFWRRREPSGTNGRGDASGTNVTDETSGVKRRGSNARDCTSGLKVSGEKSGTNATGETSETHDIGETSRVKLKVKRHVSLRHLATGIWTLKLAFDIPLFHHVEPHIFDADVSHRGELRALYWTMHLVLTPGSEKLAYLSRSGYLGEYMQSICTGRMQSRQ